MTCLHVLGSGSRGNCFALVSDGAVLLIDAGFSCREIERRAVLAGLDLAGLVGVVITHEHGDHAAGVPRLVQRRPVPVLSSRGTWSRLLRARAARPPRRPRHAGVSGPGPLHRHRLPPTMTPQNRSPSPSSATADPVGVALDLARPTAAVRFLLRDAPRASPRGQPRRGAPPHQWLPAIGAAADRGLGRPPLQPGRRRAAARALPRRPRPRGAGAPERAVQFTGVRPAKITAALEELGYSGRLHIADQAVPLEPMEIRGNRAVVEQGGR